MTLVRKKSSSEKKQTEKNSNSGHIIELINTLKEIFPELSYQQCRRMETDSSFMEGFIMGVLLLWKKVKEMRVG